MFDDTITTQTYEVTGNSGFLYTASVISLHGGSVRSAYQVGTLAQWNVTVTGTAAVHSAMLAEFPWLGPRTVKMHMVPEGSVFRLNGNYYRVFTVEQIDTDPGSYRVLTSMWVSIGWSWAYTFTDAQDEAVTVLSAQEVVDLGMRL